MKKNKIQKAQDVFNSSNFVFSKKTSSFDEAFPEIADITINILENGEGVNQYNKERTYPKQYLPGEYINCSNNLCYNGGFSIGNIIRDMIRNEQTELEISKLCQGNEGSPKGRRIYRKCLNFFKIKIKLKYKNIQDKN